MTKKEIEILKNTISHKRNKVNYKDFIDFLLINEFLDFCLNVEPKLVLNDLENQYLKKAKKKFTVDKATDKILAFINQQIDDLSLKDDESFYRKRKFLFKTNNRNINVPSIDISYLKDDSIDQRFSSKENRLMNEFNNVFYETFMSKIDYFMYDSLFMLYAEDIAQETRFISFFNDFGKQSVTISPYFLNHEKNKKIGNFLEEYCGFFINGEPAKYKAILLQNLNSFISHVYQIAINSYESYEFTESPIHMLFNGNRIVNILYKSIYNMDINLIFDMYICETLDNLKDEWIKNSTLQNEYINNIYNAFGNESGYDFFNIEIRGHHNTFDRTSNPIEVMKIIFEYVYVQELRYETILKLNFFYKTDFKLNKNDNKSIVRISKYLINHKTLKNRKSTEQVNN